MNSPTNAPDSPENVLLSGWPTPNTLDHMKSSNLKERKKKGGCSNLKDVAPLAGWPTPTTEGKEWSREAIDRWAKHGQTTKHGLDLGGAARMASGKTPNGSHAPTGRRGQLNPDFTRWLMGFRVEWGSCAPTGTRSSRK